MKTAVKQITRKPISTNKEKKFTSTRIRPRVIAQSNHTRLQNDKWERQADEAADRIIRGETGVARILTPRPAASMKVLASRGEPLPRDVREELERGFGADLAAVRIHRDVAANAAAWAESARAFTSGVHIYFSENRFRPDIPSGRELLTHEVAHVLQQTGRLSSNQLLQVVRVEGNGDIQCDLLEEIFKQFDFFQMAPDLEEIVARHQAENPSDKELRVHCSFLLDSLGNFSDIQLSATAFIERINKPGFIQKPEHRALYFDILKALKQYSAAMDLVQDKIPQKTGFGLASFYREKLRGESTWLADEMESSNMRPVINQIFGFSNVSWLSGTVNWFRLYMRGLNDKTPNTSLKSSVEKIFVNEIRTAATSEKLIPNERFYVALAAFCCVIKFISEQPVDRIKIIDQEEASDATKQITKSNLKEIAREQLLPGEALELMRIVDLEIIKAMYASRASLQQTKVEEEKADQTGKEKDLTLEVQVEISTPETAAPFKPSLEAGETKEETVGVSAAPIEEMEPQPTFKLPPMPDTELSPEELAKLEAEREKSAAAIEEATSSSGVLDAYSKAPPSVMAVAQLTLGEKIGTQVQTEQQEFEDNIPEIVVVTGGEDKIEGPTELDTGSKTADDLEGATPPPAEMPELPPTQNLGKFDQNNKIVDFIKRFFGAGDNEMAVRNSLRDVKTKDPEVETSLGPPPKVPLENDTDPKRVTDQQEQMRRHTHDERDRAMQAIVDGPGPEQVQVRELKAQAAVEPFELPEIKEMVAAEGASEFTSRELPPEVTAKFDEDYSEQMMANMEEGRQKVKQAETERDEGRAQELKKTDQQRDALTKEADEGQKKEVIRARETIQAERQATIDEQDKAVADLEQKAEIEKTETQKDIKKKNEETNKKVTQKYNKAEIDAKEKVSKGEKDAEAELSKAEKEAENKSWWEKAVDFVKDAFAALTKAISAIFDAVRSAVNIIFDAVKSAVKGLIDAAASVIKGIIKTFGEVIKGLVNTLLADTFPGLAKKLNKAINSAVEAANKAVDVVADTLKAGVDALVGILQKGLNAVLNVFQSAVNVAFAVVEAAITGDWSGLIHKLIESTLRLVGISPEAFYSFVGKTADTLKIIIDAPGKFLGNCVDAVKKGFGLFGDRFLKHLKAGIIGWLTGSLGGDIQIPKRFDLVGVLDLARQVMGLTWEWLRKMAVRLIGEKNVERLEFAFDYIKTLAQEGWGVLFEKIKESLSNLKDVVLDKIKEFLVARVIKAGITWLVSLFNPVGALVKLVMTMWNLYTFLRDQLSRIIEIAKSLISGIDKIARGVIQQAAEKVEGVLARLLPIAIDLVARLLGLGNVGKKVREIIKNIRKRINKAAEKLLNKVMKRFKKKDAEKADTKGAEEAEAGQIKLGRAMTVTEPSGKAHTLSIDIKGKDATIMLRSKPMTVKAWIEEFKNRAQNLKDDEKDKNKIAGQLISKAIAVQKSLDAESDKEVKKPKPINIPSILEQETKLRDTLISLFKILGTSEEVPIADLFKAQIDAAHTLAKKSLIKALLANLDEWQSLPWDTIREKLIANKTVPFYKPLLAEHEFGKEMQKSIREKLDVLRKSASQQRNESKSKSIPSKENEMRFISDSFIKSVHYEKSPKYKDTLEELRNALFDKSKFKTADESLDEALNLALSKEKVDEDLKEAVNQKKDVIEFLENIAEGKQVKNINFQEFKVRWEKKANREWIKEKFRARDPGKHEWIPTNYILEVIKHAHSISTPEAEGTAARWVTFHHELRSETGILIFNPNEPKYSVMVDEIKDKSNPSKRRKISPSVPILQGHTGAVYAPYSGGEYAEPPAPKPQITGQDAWHNGLRAIFKENKNQESKAAMESIVNKTEKYLRTTLWSGNKADLGVPVNRFSDYYKSKTDSKLSSPAFLIVAAKKGKEQIKEDFDRAKKAVGIG